MITLPQTLEEARAYRYGSWAGNPNGAPFQEGCCAMAVWSGGRGSCESQCSRKNGFGPGGLYCKQHDPEAVKKKWEEKYAQSNAESAARAARAQRTADCVEACQGLPDPATALAAARVALAGVLAWDNAESEHDRDAMVEAVRTALAQLQPRV